VKRLGTNELKAECIAFHCTL